MRDDAVRHTTPEIRLLEKAAFLAGATSAGEARRWLGKILDGHPRRDDAVLLLSEAITNALVHTTSPVIGAVVFVEEDGCVQVEVVDDGAETVPSVCRHSPGDLTESGRGIRLIRALSSRWGFIEERPRCVVWFALGP